MSHVLLASWFMFSLALFVVRIFCHCVVFSCIMSQEYAHAASRAVASCLDDSNRVLWCPVIVSTPRFSCYVLVFVLLRVSCLSRISLRVTASGLFLRSETCTNFLLIYCHRIDSIFRQGRCSLVAAYSMTLPEGFFNRARFVHHASC